jgi:hypothetical protein
MKSLILAFCALTIIGVSGCKKDNNPVSSDGTLGYFTGRVIDSNGTAISGAKIHAIPNVIETSSFEKISSINDIIQFQFSLPQISMVNLILLRKGTSDTVAIIIKNSEMPAGVHSIFFDSDSLTAGIYTMKLEFGSERIENDLILLKEPSELVNANALIKTDTNGKFVLSNKIFAIGASYTRTSEVSPDSIGAITVTNNVTFLIMKEGYKNLIQNVFIDTTYANYKAFIMEKH